MPFIKIQASDASVYQEDKEEYLINTDRIIRFSTKDYSIVFEGGFRMLTDEQGINKILQNVGSVI